MVLQYYNDYHNYLYIQIRYQSDNAAQLLEKIIYISQPQFIAICVSHCKVIISLALWFICSPGLLLVNKDYCIFCE